MERGRERGRGGVNRDGVRGRESVRDSARERGGERDLEGETDLHPPIPEQKQDCGSCPPCCVLLSLV